MSNSYLSPEPQTWPMYQTYGHVHLDISWAPQTVLLAVLKLSSEKGVISPHSSCAEAPE